MTVGKNKKCSYQIYCFTALPLRSIRKNRALIQISRMTSTAYALQIE